MFMKKLPDQLAITRDVVKERCRHLAGKKWFSSKDIFNKRNEMKKLLRILFNKRNSMLPIAVPLEIASSDEELEEEVHLII